MKSDIDAILKAILEDTDQPLGGHTPEPEPEPVPTRRLDEILTPEQFRQIQKIWKMNPDKEKARIKMRDYFRTIQTELEAKGVIPDYLAYLLYAKFMGIV